MKKQLNEKLTLPARIGLAILIVILSVLPASAAGEPFDTVMILDTSGSMYGSMSEMKESAKDFCDDILANNAKNQIAIIEFNSGTYITCTFTNDSQYLYSAIDTLDDGGGTNMYDAIIEAEKMLTAPESVNKIKNVIIMADGYPGSGTTLSSGKYSSKYTTGPVPYCNAVYDAVVSRLHPIANVYSVGLFDFDASDFDNLYSTNQLCVEFMRDLANAKTYFPDSAAGMFSNVAEEVVKATTTTTPVTTTEKPSETTTVTTTVTTTAVTTTKKVVASSATLASTEDSDDSDSSVGVKVAIGVACTGGVGGFVALIIYLLTKSSKPPIVPIAAPIIIPDDDDDDDNEIKNYRDYEAPGGLSSFAAGVGAGVAIDAVASFNPVGSQIYGVSGVYRGASIDIADGETIYIGRDAKNSNLVITSDYAKVSRKHCSVQYCAARSGFMVTDLSKNGTSTKELKLTLNSPTFLPNGSEIQLADSTNIFRLG